MDFRLAFFFVDLKMPKTRSVVVALLHKCENKEISVELKSGDVFKGILIKSEDNMNVQVKI